MNTVQVFTHLVLGWAFWSLDWYVKLLVCTSVVWLMYEGHWFLPSWLFDRMGSILRWAEKKKYIPDTIDAIYDQYIQQFRRNHIFHVDVNFIIYRNRTYWLRDDSDDEIEIEDAVLAG
jgi:hypothetical protein